jgi:hypothetical protein
MPIAPVQSVGIELPIVPPAVWEPPAAEEEDAALQTVVAEPPSEERERFDRAAAAEEGDAPVEQSDEPATDPEAREAKQEIHEAAAADSMLESQAASLEESGEESASSEAEDWDGDRALEPVLLDAESGVVETEPVEPSSEESSRPKQAVVREGGRNPRYQR